jgi:NhaP-type Na+/H+ or K+/H+ antiporter
MTAATWDLFVGALLILMAMSGSLLNALPISAAALYLGIGFLVGPSVLDLWRLEIHPDARLVEQICEATVLISLFASACGSRCVRNGTVGGCRLCWQPPRCSSPSA